MASDKVVAAAAGTTIRQWADRYPGDPKALGDALIVEIERLTGALERIALLDEADGHELTVDDALQAVAIATSTLGKHPSEILAARLG